MSVTLDDITRYRIIPVVVLNDAAKASGSATRWSPVASRSPR